MSLDIDVATGNTRVPVSRDNVIVIARAALRYERVKNALVSITFVGPSAIARLNREHLAHEGTTDVISFGFERATPSDPVIGDIYICVAVARANAKARRVGVREEIARLVIHGILHVLGYDHPEDEAREESDMWRRQERLLRRLVNPSDARR